jgi:predicted esterase
MWSWLKNLGPMLIGSLAMGLESRDFLKALHVAVEWHQYPMAHSVCTEELTDIRHFLFRMLPEASR